MYLKRLAIAALLANLCIIAPSFSGAQAGTLFNGSNSSSGGAATPVFIPTPAATTPSTPVSSNLFTNSGQTDSTPTTPSTKPMTDEQYAQMAADVEKQNATVGAQRSAAVKANFDQVAAQNAAAQKAAASQHGSGGGAAAAQAQQPADPYAGHTVVFTGAKKTDDKPVRLFNVQ